MPKIFLAATSHVKTAIMPFDKPKYVLESFMDLKSKSKQNEEFINWIFEADDFLLDSGAFSFMNSRNKIKNINIDDYICNYINFINRYDIKHFFEMDIDCFLNFSDVIEIRKKIESSTNKKCIPVWHKSRGEQEFSKMCDEYNYVAIGGIASREIKKSEWDMLYKLCDVAHEKNVKIHGLGFLPLEILNSDTCPFDTVDGTSWQGHMRKKSFYLENNNIYSKKDDRYWKDIILDCFKVWNEYIEIKKYR